MTDVAGVDLIDGTGEYAASEPQVSPPMTLPDAADAARLARVAELQRRRAAARPTPASGVDVPPPHAVDTVPATTTPTIPTTTPTTTPTTAHPRRAGAAAGSKIAAAGFGFAAMLGLVAAMGYASRSSAAAPQPAPTPAVPTQVVVVIHPAAGSAASVTAPASPGARTASSSEPIVLSAQPTVRQAPASQAPAGQTNGSR
jgi:hypothetical protein